MKLRHRWVEYIVKKNSTIYAVKKSLATAHGYDAFLLMIRVVYEEVVLSIISLPTYFFLSTKTIPGHGQQSYRLRRAATLLILIPVIILWSVRGVRLLSESIQNDIVDFSHGPSEISGESISEWQKLLLSLVSPRITTPVVYQSFERDKLMIGKADPDKTIVIMLQRNSNAPVVAFITVTPDAKGNWAVPLSLVKNSAPGSYSATAIAYDDSHRERSLVSPTLRVKVPKTEMQIIGDTVAHIGYITVGALLMLGVVLSLIGD